MPHRLRPVFDPIVMPILRFANWFFGYGAPGLDLLLGVLAAGWTTLMIARPEIFDQGSYLGMTWLPDPAWIAISFGLALGHAFGLRRPDWLNWRLITMLGSSWLWLCVCASFLRVDIGTGVLSYFLFGSLSLLGAIYVGGLPRRVF